MQNQFLTQITLKSSNLNAALVAMDPEHRCDSSKLPNVETVNRRNCQTSKLPIVETAKRRNCQTSKLPIVETAKRRIFEMTECFFENSEYSVNLSSKWELKWITTMLKALWRHFFRKGWRTEKAGMIIMVCNNYDNSRFTVKQVLKR